MANRDKMIGADAMVGQDSVPARSPIVGTDGNDLLLGTGGADQIWGRGGSDVLRGGNGDDRLSGGASGPVGDVLLDGNGRDWLDGGAGGDVLDGGNGNDRVLGRMGNDFLDGGDGNDLVSGGPGTDSLVGGLGQDRFLFNGDPFNNAVPASAMPGGIRNVNAPDTVNDFKVGTDKFVLDGDDFDVEELSFANGAVDDLSGDANVLVLQGSFANAGAAAQAIADNDALTADAGAFVYANETLGFNRLVYSSDLGDGGSFSVQANLTNQPGEDGIALLADYAASDFQLA